MQMTAYLFFDGNCAEAMHYYERALGGKIEMSMTQADDPTAAAQTPPDSPARIIHARLDFAGGVLMASDWMAGHAYPGMSGFALSLAYTTVADAKKIFDVLADGGTVTMPFEETFWVEAFGMLTDRFGTRWMVNGGKAKV